MKMDAQLAKARGGALSERGWEWAGMGPRDSHSGTGIRPGRSLRGVLGRAERRYYSNLVVKGRGTTSMAG